MHLSPSQGAVYSWVGDNHDAKLVFSPATRTNVGTMRKLTSGGIGIGIFCKAAVVLHVLAIVIVIIAVVSVIVAVMGLRCSRYC